MPSPVASSTCCVLLNSFSQPALGQAICSLVGCDPLCLCDLENREHCGIDRKHLGLDLFGRPSKQVGSAAEHAACVGDIIRRVENSALLERVSVPPLEELIVSCAANDPGFEER